MILPFKNKVSWGWDYTEIEGMMSPDLVHATCIESDYDTNLVWKVERQISLVREAVWLDMRFERDE